MEKDAYYFSHDSNARFDNKIIKLRAKYGLEGYGFYFCLLEIMRDNSDYKINYEDIDTIAFQLQTDCSKAKAMLDDCLTFGLFILEDKKNIYSESLLNRMEKMNELRAKRQEAGRKGGNAKAKLKQNSSMKRKESKVKESKREENIKEIFVDLSFEEIIFDWFEYKKLRKEKYVNEKSEIAFMNKLKKLSGNNPKTAREIIDESMANNWAGIFQLKQNNKVDDGVDYVEL